MTDIDKVAVRPEPPIQEPAGPGATGRRIAALAVVGVLACSAALGVGAFAAAGDDHAAWRQGLPLAFAQRIVARTLDSVGASADQEAKIHDIIAARFEAIAPKPGDREAMRKRAIELLAAPTIDRAAVEKLRADAVADFDAKSKAVVGGLLEIADQLTPEQRSKLADQLAHLPPHGPMGWGGHPGPAFGAPDMEPDKD